MLIFHEGLPGSGKSYEAMAKHILPAIDRGRRVYAHIDGLNDPDCLTAISECLGLPLSTIQDRLIYLSKDQVLKIWDHIEPNCLVVIDELQNYFPVSRDKPRPELSEWVSKHRHDGIDILCLGQSLKDVHNIWKRRIDRKVVFQKLDALGSVNRYRWIAYKSIGEMRFEKTTEGIESYQVRYFGTYKSHNSEEVSTVHYSDKRAVLWNSPVMRFAILFVALGGVLIPWYLFRQFDADTTSLISVPAAPVAPAVSNSVQASGRSTASVQASGSAAPAVPAVPPVSDSRSKGLEYVDFLSTAYRVRLSSVLQGSGKTYVVVEYRDEALRIQDRLDQFALQHLGWSVQVVNLQMVILSKGSRLIVATPWPLQSLGEVSDEHNRQVSEKPIGPSEL